MTNRVTLIGESGNTCQLGIEIESHLLRAAELYYLDGKEAPPLCWEVGHRMDREKCDNVADAIEAAAHVGFFDRLGAAPEATRRVHQLRMDEVIPPSAESHIGVDVKLEALLVVGFLRECGATFTAK